MHKTSLNRSFRGRRSIEAPTIQKSGDTFVMFYAGAYNKQPQQIGVAFKAKTA